MTKLDIDSANPELSITDEPLDGPVALALITWWNDELMGRYPAEGA